MRPRLPVALLVLTAAVPARSETITYRNPAAADGLPAKAVGAIVKDSAAAVTVRPTIGKEVTIPAGDIIEVAFEPPAAARLELPAAQKAEQTDPAGARKLYEALAKKLDVKEPLGRHVRFRAAALAVAAADEATAREAAALRAEAVAALKAFRTEFPECWQQAAATRLLAGLLADAGDVKGAAAAFDELAGKDGMTAAAKSALDLEAADLLARAKDYAGAATRLTRAGIADPTLKPKTDLLAAAVEGLQAPGRRAEALAKAQAVIDDPAQAAGLKALAYNVRGDCLQADGKKRDALWSYLYVDVVYPQDRHETVKAVDRLARLFEEFRDEPRSVLYRDKYRRLR